MFRAQGEAMADALERNAPLVDLTARNARATVDGLWNEARKETEAQFLRGAKALLRAGMTVGAERYGKSLGVLAEASPKLGFLPPPDLATDLRFDSAGHAILAGTPFGLDNPRAVGWVESHGAQLVARVDDTTRDMLRDVVSGGVAQGRSSEKIAKDIITLFPEMAEGRPQEHIDSRAHGIAVTEMTFAYEQGQLTVATQMQDAGLTVKKSWLTVGDENVDDDCASNEDAGEIDLDDSFPSGDSEPPAHPYCRCTTTYRVLTSDELAAAPAGDTAPSIEPETRPVAPETPPPAPAETPPLEPTALPVAPETPPSDIAWQPAMTADDAKAWTSGTRTDGEVWFHHTTADAAQAITQGGFKETDGILGRGIYLTNDSSAASINRQFTSDTLQVAVRADRVADIEKSGFSGVREWMDLNRIAGETDPSQVASRLGIDAFRVPQADGSTWLVSMSRTSVSVVDDAAPRAIRLADDAAAAAAKAGDEVAGAVRGLPETVTIPDDDAWMAALKGKYTSEDFSAGIERALRLKAERAGTSIDEYKAAAAKALDDALVDAKPHIAISDDALQQVLKDGRVKSQFETNTSRGSLAPDMRAKVEQSMFGYAKDLPVEQRPIYGYWGTPGDPIIQSPKGGGLRFADASHTGATAYGKVILRLSDDVASRTTFTGGDSLGMTMRPSMRGRAAWQSASSFTSPVGKTLPQIAENELYVEAQVHGGVAVSDIAEVWFREVPERATDAALRAAGFDRTVLPGNVFRYGRV